MNVSVNRTIAYLILPPLLLDPSITPRRANSRDISHLPSPAMRISKIRGVNAVPQSPWKTVKRSQPGIGAIYLAKLVYHRCFSTAAHIYVSLLETKWVVNTAMAYFFFSNVKTEICSPFSFSPSSLCCFVSPPPIPFPFFPLSTRCISSFPFLP